MMPYDYVMNFMLSLCPYMWRTVMDPRVDSLREKRKGIDEKLEAEIEKKVKVYYQCLVILVSSLAFMSL